MAPFGRSRYAVFVQDPICCEIILDDFEVTILVEYIYILLELFSDGTFFGWSFVIGSCISSEKVLPVILPGRATIARPGVLECQQPRGSPLRPFPRVFLCPLNIPKITIVHGIGCSLNLNISCYLGVLAEAGCYKKSPNFWAGTPPLPPLNKQHNQFHPISVPSHIKSCTDHEGRGRRIFPRQKKTPGFLVYGRHMAKNVKI